MSEKIYSFFLRLYPARFREEYGDEALQLFRDRSRDERGFFLRLRLWLDLLADLAISIPQAYGHIQPELAAASALRGTEGVPSFYVLEEESLRPGALLFGGAATLTSLIACWVLLGLGGNHPTRWTKTTGRSQADSGYSGNKRSQPKRQAAAGNGTDATKGNTSLDKAERERVVDGTIANLKQHYAYPDVAQRMADALRAHERNGDDDAVANGEAFAALLTKQMREVSPDKHLDLIYSSNPLLEPASRPTPEGAARYREAMEQQNCTFERIEILPHNIGFLKLNSFPDVSVCQQKAADAMRRLNNADAIIFDLRDNRGGEPDMTAFLAAYLFDHPEFWYNPRENTTERSWTRSPVEGNKLADKPVFVLISEATFSGAEQFCYDLKMLKRATLVGETTGGGAHAGVWHRIDDHFGMGIPEVKAINPYAKMDWAETGVEPDVKVKAQDALETARKLAIKKLQKRQTMTAIQ